MTKETPTSLTQAGTALIFRTDHYLDFKKLTPMTSSVMKHGRAIPITSTPCG